MSLDIIRKTISGLGLVFLLPFFVAWIIARGIWRIMRNQPL